MKKIVNITIDKLQGEGSYFGRVSMHNPHMGEEEFHAEDFKTLWDRITFFLVDRVDEIEEYKAI